MTSPMDARGFRKLTARISLKTRKRMLRSRKFGKKESDERGITEDFVVWLARRSHGSVEAIHVDSGESEHGADIELWLRGGGLLLGFRLQAKCLKPNSGSRKPGSYQSLFDTVGTSPDFQVDKLISNTPSPLIPAYLFYNGLPADPVIPSDCCSDNEWRKDLGWLGITVAPAQVVSLLKDITPRRKTLGHVLPDSLPLPCIAYCENDPYSWHFPPGAMPLRAARTLDFIGVENIIFIRDPITSAGSEAVERAAEQEEFQISDSYNDFPYLSQILEGNLSTDTEMPPVRYLMIWDAGLRQP
ncbi:DUF6615 family protein [Actinoplanes sp. NPDC026670]|uniref:DUF6615 family protein n=1 Tax=Actinoplanes sp. NPDC026670 TaxID=3154700 RepID=UPI0033EB3A65